MNSQTHLLIACTLFARPGTKLRNTAVVIGSFIPDAAIYTLFIWSKLAGVPEQKVWHELYWREPWQTWTAAGNSIPLYVLLLIAGVAALRTPTATFRIGVVLTFFALAALTHLAGDMPVHVDDAHRHFWPFSDWKFISPVSYWQANHHGGIFSLLESVLGILLAIILYRRFTAWWIRVLLVLICLAYIAVPVYFTLMFGG